MAGGYALGMFGFININKPPGPTSFGAVAAVRRHVGRKTKVGHAGTLDPFAQGVLVISVGPATRLTSYVHETAKRYQAGITLGATSTTDDVEGEITPGADVTAPDVQTVRQAAARFVGCIEQIPPTFSAVHVGGQRAYHLARRGADIEIPPRPVTIHGIEVVRYDYPTLLLDVRCGSGTYIRSLARDIGAALGTGGYCTSLTRTAVGPFLLDDAVALGQVDPARHILSPLIALGEMPRLTLDQPQITRIVRGQAVGCEYLPAAPPPDADEFALVDAAGSLLALARLSSDGQAIKPTKVFISR